MYKIVYFPSEKNELIVSDLKNQLDALNFVENDDFEYLLIVGGDGSFIHFSKEYAFQRKKIIGIKNGRMSFLSTILKSKDLNHLVFSDFYLLKIEIGDRVIYAVNEVYISGDSMLQANIYINEVYFQNYLGSGLIFSTQMGSTAQSRSFGGPILFPSMISWFILEVGSYSSKNQRSLNNALVISAQDYVKIFNLHDARLYIDGKLENLNSEELRISYVKSNSMVLFVSSEQYVNKLREAFVYEERN